MKKKLTQKQMHENWLIIHRFEHEEEPKKWLVNDKTYTGDYHKDWLWIMPVILKIGEETGYELVMKFNESYWNKFGNDPLEDKNFGGYENPFEIYKAVVAFLKWYNKNKK